MLCLSKRISSDDFHAMGAAAACLGMRLTPLWYVTGDAEMDRVTATSPKSARPTGDLPLSKLRGLPSSLRVALKARRITTCEQLLRVAGSHAGRRQLLS